MNPNLAIKLNSAGFLTLGLFSLFFVNNVLGGLMIFYSIINLSALYRKGDRPYKLSVLKTNFVLTTIVFVLLSLLVLDENKNKNKIKNTNVNAQLIIVLPLITILVISNYLAIKFFRV